jgi:[ribosomal protein S5]-alanine N-acetyltransferase
MKVSNNVPLPVLATERLTLRRLQVDDAPQLFVLRSDSGVNQYLDRQPSRSIADVKDFMAAIQKGIDNNGLYYWGITFTHTATLVGTICLFNFSQGRSTCEIGYELLPRFQGQGLMREAAGAVIGHCFNVLGLLAIEAVTHKNNAASEKLLRQLGFSQKAEQDSTHPDCRVFILTK